MEEGEVGRRRDCVTRQQVHTSNGDTYEGEMWEGRSGRRGEGVPPRTFSLYVSPPRPPPPPRSVWGRFPTLLSCSPTPPLVKSHSSGRKIFGQYLPKDHEKFKSCNDLLFPLYTFRCQLSMSYLTFVGNIYLVSK